MIDARQLLVDLEALGTLALLGPTEHTTAFARSLALELASGTDLADAYVTTVGLDLDPQLAPRHRLIERGLISAGRSCEATHLSEFAVGVLNYQVECTNCTVFNDVKAFAIVNLILFLLLPPIVMYFAGKKRPVIFLEYYREVEPGSTNQSLKAKKGDSTIKEVTEHSDVHDIENQD